jgi:hypothetical protein
MSVFNLSFSWMPRSSPRWRDVRTLEDVKAGRVIEHHAVQAWANSLSTGNPLPLPRK